MEKLVLPYDMECMKMAMLKHEETFKQQVYELHRLYQTQRMLMKNMQRSLQNHETWSSKSGPIDLDYTLNKHKKKNIYPVSNEYDLNENGSSEIENECEIELTLGPTSYARKKNKPTLTTKMNSDSMASFSSSSTGSSHKSMVTIENSRVLRVDEQQMRQVDRSLNRPSWFHQIII